MRIGIDARAIEMNPKGLGRYTISILKEILKIDVKNEYFLYSYKYIPDFNNFNNVKKRIGKTFFRKLKGTFWMQTEGLYMIYKDKLDLFWSPLQILPYLMPRKLKKIITVHDILVKIYPETMEKTNLIINKIYLKNSIKMADCIFTVSKTTLKDIEKYFNLKIKNKTIVTYNGVDTNSIFKIPKLEAKNYILEKFGINKKYILSLSTIEPRKNLIYLLKAFNDLKEKLDDYILVLVGEKGWNESEVFNFINNNLKEKIIFTGYVEEKDLKYLYSASEVFIFPSKYEGFGIPLIEAIACGSKVLASDIEVFREILKDEDILFSLNDIKDIEKKIIENLDLEKKQKIDISEYNWGKSADEILEIIKK